MFPRENIDKNTFDYHSKKNVEMPHAELCDNLGVPFKEQSLSGPPRPESRREVLPVDPRGAIPVRR